MSKLHATPNNHKFAWLTPLQTNTTANGPWMLYENRTQNNNSVEHSDSSVTVDALLRVVSAAFSQDDQEPGLNDTHNTPIQYKSQCGRFEIRRYKLEQDDSRLFLQKRTDYFQRLELLVDNRLQVAYHEPVWPHLQDANASLTPYLTLPAGCMEFLERLAADSYTGQPSACSSNQPTYARGRKSAAA